MARRKPLPDALPVIVSHLDADHYGTAEVQQGEVVRNVHLRNALPGEQVTARILKRRRGRWYGNAVTVEQAAEHRRDAVCAVFPRCGGCALQHVQAQTQLSEKEAVLASALQEEQVAAQRWRGAITGPQYGYRRKARLGVRAVSEQVFVGFREAFASRVVDMHGCPTLDARLSAMIEPLRDTIALLSVARSIPQIEVAAGDQDTAIAIRHLEPLTTADIGLLEQLAAMLRADVYTQSGGYETVQPLPGRPARLLSYGLPEFGLNIQFSAVEFTQVNAEINQRLVRHAIAGLEGCERVADLFCGIGNFALALARRGKRVWGLEASPLAIQRAAANANRNGVAGDSTFAVADLYTEASAVLPLPQDVDGMLLDPPRSGAGPHLAAWLQPSLRRVSYVSCNPLSFAADARVLQDAGFVLEEVGVFDMFPQTTHVETLGVFRRG